MADYRRVYDTRHLQADCQEPGSAPACMQKCSSGLDRRHYNKFSHIISIAVAEDYNGTAN